MKKLVYTVSTENGSFKDRETGEINTTPNWAVAKVWASALKGQIVPHYINIPEVKPATI